MIFCQLHLATFQLDQVEISLTWSIESTIYEYILKQMNKPKDQLHSDFVSTETVSVDQVLELNIIPGWWHWSGKK